MHIAMWSGPRNLSTAMMYSFAQRSDCFAWDEPFYSAYLTRTGITHPMGDQVIAAGEPDPDKVIARLRGPVPDGKAHFYQKHMTQHMLPGIDRDWLRDVTNVFLIRHPARVVASFSAKLEDLTLDEIGFRQQFELYELAKSFGQTPIVIDSHDIREDPEAALRKLCAALGLDFEPAMLSWPKGGRPEDGVWAPVWYGAVHGSTGFAGAEGPLPALPAKYAGIVEEAMTYYEPMRAVAHEYVIT